MFDKTSKYMRFMRNLWFIFILIIAFMACSDDKDVLAPVPNDVTLNELELGRFTHAIPDGGFTSKAAHKNSVTFNTKKNSDGTYAGFAYSNRNNRSFTWTATQEALDSNIYINIMVLFAHRYLNNQIF